MAAPRLKGAPSPVAPGAVRFAALPEADQRAVLGPGMYEAWKDGRVSLTPTGANSIVGVRQDVRWGTTRYARGLTDMVGAERAAGYVAKARQGALGEWTPVRTDAALVGRVGDAAWAALSERTRVRQVYAVPETWEHIAERHNRDLDVGLARDLLPSILAQPEIIYRSASRPDSLLFAGRYDAQHFLVVVTKALGDEFWLATVYKDRDYNVLKRAQKAGIVYRR